MPWPDSPSEYNLHSDFHLPPALVAEGRALRAEGASRRALEMRLPEGRAQYVSVRISAVQPVGGVVRRHLEFGVNPFAKVDRLGEVRIQIPEMRARQAAVL